MQQLRRFLTFDDVGLIPKFNSIRSRLHVNLQTKVTTKINSNIPFIPANMDTVMGSELAAVLKSYGGIGIFHRFSPIEKRLEWLTDFPDFFHSCGIADWDDTLILIKAGCKRYCIDIAHGHSIMVGEMIQKIKSNCPEAQIIAGNVCTVEGFDYLCTMGADAIKVGVGGGAACSTRMVTGVGIPQFSAVYEISRYRDLLNNKKGKYIPIIADGGIRDSRDICLALAAGADTVMMGSIFCKTFESACPKFKDEDGNTFGKYRGQASANFQNDYFGKVKEGTVPEGIDFTVKITKSSKEVIDEFSGALRSSMTYLGASNMEEYHLNADFFESTPNYLPESKPRKDDVAAKL
jgi:IMP dehydrogenase